MATIITREVGATAKGTTLSNIDLDNNFINLNADIGTRVPSSEKGVANGIATLDSSGKVPSIQLPSYVDDVAEYTNLAAFPATGEAGKIYVALDTNKTYRWGGSSYVYITSGAVDSVAGKTGVVTLVKGDVGLGNVDNTADSAKSVNYANSAGAVAWSGITSKPTTLSGYGITDAATSTHNHNGTYQPLDADLTAIAGLTGTSGLLKKTAADTWMLDTSTYLTGNQSISITGDATGSGTTSIALTLSNSGVAAGSYGSATSIPQITVDTKGRITTVSNVAVSIPSGSLTFTGDVTGTGSTGSSTALTLANSGVTAGTYTKVTVDAKGRVTTGASLASTDLPTYTGPLTSSQVTTALGFTPYNSTNPSGYISGITSSMVTTALGYTPYNSTNPNGYITSSGTAAVAVTHQVTDSRSTATTPQSINQGVVFDFKGNATDGLSDGGTYFGEMTFRQYGSSTDWTGGLSHQLGFTDNGNIWQRSGSGTTWGSWKKLLDSSNYTSYSPSLTGSGASGTWGIGITGGVNTTGDFNIVNSSSGNTAGAWYGRTGAKNAIADRAVFVGVYNGNAAVGAHNNALTAWADLYVNTVDGSSGGFVRLPGTTYVSGNQVLHAGNYTSYSPSLTGSGASGSWGISVTGSAGSVAWSGVTSKPTTLSGYGITDAAPSSHVGSTGTAHGNATTSVAGFMSSTDKSKLDGIASGATANTGTVTSVSGTGTVSGLTLSGTVTVSGSLTLGGTLNISGVTGLTRSSLAAADSLTNLTNANFRTKLFGGTASGFNLSAGRWDSTPAVLSGLSSYGTMVAWSGNDTHGFLALNYNSAGAIIGGGNADTINWTATLLHSSNYNSYSPTLTGGGASGTWGINITGSAGSAGSLTGGDSNFYGILYSSNSGDLNTYNNPGLYSSEYIGSTNNPAGASNNGHWIQISDAGGTDVKTQWYFHNGGSDISMRLMWGNGGWKAWRKLLHDGNYTSYSPSLTGSGASGTWGINITGSAGNADTVDGLHAHSGTNNEANKIVRTDANGYIQAGWINTISGNLGAGNRLDRVWCSNDQYMRYLSLTEFKMQMGLSAKSNYQRYVDYTSDSNYWVGSMGGSGYGANEVFHGGSGFVDMWSGTNYPGGLTHVHGFNALHYTTNSFGTTGGNAYGIQVVGNYGAGGELWSRGCSGGTFSAWRRLLDSSNYTSYSPSLTGSGASGTWGINVTGSAGSVAWGNVSGRPTAVSSFTNDSGYITSSGSISGNAATATRTSGYGSAGPDSWHAGTGMWAAYCWGGTNNGGGATAPTSSHYLTGIDVGSHPGDQSYGFQIVNPMWQNEWWFRTYASGYYGYYRMLHNGNYNSYAPSLTGSGASGTWGISITGNSASTSQTTWTDLYVNSWLRNNSSNTGLYNQANANHFYSRAGNRWGITGNGSSSNIYIDLFGNHETTLRGSIHADTSSNLGFLNSSGSWTVRTDQSGNFIATANVTAYSDERLKTDWRLLPLDFIERLAKVRTGTYTRIDINERQAGSSAQDWQKLLPEVVYTANDDTSTLSLAYGNAALVSAVELAKRVVEQDARINRLEEIINKLIGD